MISCLYTAEQQLLYFAYVILAYIYSIPVFTFFWLRYFLLINFPMFTIFSSTDCVPSLLDPSKAISSASQSKLILCRCILTPNNHLLFHLLIASTMHNFKIRIDRFASLLHRFSNCCFSSFLC